MKKTPNQASKTPADTSSTHRDEELTNEKIVHEASEDAIETHEDDRRRHQSFGNRKYESFSNHSSADDQPTTDTGTP
ncbi:MULTISPECIES: hypothetical protein [unclassified Flavobacterium]|uniref:hypothetical protein n=1 Tax=unclassified Flavobacterium TaxID=196869 RepID=UPI001F138651|nr:MULTISPECIES: hypothetical protein [unclassified Flavobacterium]UMY65048.1 hypothetical protein MKO97_11050 [Flavobacterium sp. HJ-32-4]HLN94988.1 hypothetical protein [Flavobacterium sp.]